VNRPTSRNILEWALWYAAALGWYVFPVFEPISLGVCSCPKGEACERVGKHPRTPHGLNDATIEPSTITEWWTRWPNANIGVATGKISGIFVLDQDGLRGSAFLHARLLAADEQGLGSSRSFPATLYSTTGQLLGIHYVFKYPDDGAGVPNSAGRVGPNLDVRGDGGYFIAPPGTHESGRVYQWQNDLEPADAPEWLLRRARSRILAILGEGAQGMPPAILEGQRNSSLTSLGGTMRARGFSVRAIAAALIAENQERCVPPLSADEVARIAESLGRYQPAVNLAQPPALVFRSAREVADMTPARVPWIARPWLVEACVTEVDGKIKEAGKTTWLTFLGRAVLDGRDFLGVPTTKTPMVYLTEQSNVSFREALRRADLLDREDFMILSLHETMRLPFRNIMAAAVTKAIEMGAKVIVVDTLARWARLRGDMENSAGDAAEAVGPLREAAANHGLAVVFARHERKSGGPVGDAARGSSAIGGEVDIILSIRRPVGHANTVREIQTLSRFDETPEHLLIELTPDGYVALGNRAVVERELAEEDLLRVLPITEDTAITIREIQERTGRSRSDLQRLLALLEGAGRVARLPGRGRHPARYWQVQTEDADELERPDDTEDE
jgi:hypothetical protein